MNLHLGRINYFIVLFSLFQTACTSEFRSPIQEGLKPPGFRGDGSAARNPTDSIREPNSKSRPIDELVEKKDFGNHPEVVLPQYRFSPVNKSEPLFDWPVDEARLSRGFLPNKKRPHLGIDLAAAKNTPIYAAHSGLVIYAGRDFKGYGKMLILDSGTGWATLYAHFNSIYVQEGQRINQGDLLGGMGRTGRATGVHLHFELRKEREPIDPLSYLPHGDKASLKY